MVLLPYVPILTGYVLLSRCSLNVPPGEPQMKLLKVLEQYFNTSIRENTVLI